MANIWRLELLPDFFGDRLRSLLSLARITGKNYQDIVNFIAKEFGKSFKKVTRPLLNEIIDRKNQTLKNKISLVAKKSLLITVLVTEVKEADVSFILSFGGLDFEPAVGDEIFRELVYRVNLDPRLRLEVSNGDLIGRVTLPFSILPIPESKEGKEHKNWSNGSDPNGEAEKQFVNGIGKRFTGS